jgi:uncharacterized protein (DUF1697 family)
MTEGPGQTGTPKRRVALLRGINVGGNKQVPMAGLRAMAEELGFSDVTTHLNSGNLLFTSAGADQELAGAISRGLQSTFGFEVAVVVRTPAELDAILRGNPFPEGNPSQVCVAFLDEPPGPGTAAKLVEAAAPTERLLVAGREVYIDFGEGLARSRLAASLPALLRPRVVTVRNLRTVTKLADLLG